MNTENENKVYANSPRAIQRKLVGIRGYRFFNIPGVIYPEEVLRPKPGYSVRTGKPYASAPSWGISTADAAVLLHCTASAARAYLHKSNIRFRRVQTPGKSCKIYWCRSQVMQLVANNAPIIQTQEEGMISSTEAMRALGVSRTTLMRYGKRGLLSITAMRRYSRCGLRLNHYFRVEEIERLKKAREEWQKRGNCTLPLEHFFE